MSLEDARRVAADTSAAFRRVPGLVDFRFFGDFETGTHYYLQVWESQAALDAYAASESMFRIREIAAPFVTGRPSRRILVDYSAPQAPTTTDSP
jgi:quinol monooxygenase YgiN